MNHTAKNASLASHHSKVFTDPSLKEVHTHGTKEQPMTGIHFKCGYDTIYPDHFFVDRHWHRTVEIILIIKGSYEFEINLERHVVHEGDLVFLNSGDLHRITGLEQNTVHEVFLFNAELLVFQYSDELQENIIQPFCNHDTIFPHILHPSDLLYELFCPEIRKLLQYAIEKKESWYISCKLCLLHLLYSMDLHAFFIKKNDALSSYERQKIARYKKTVSYMEKHYSEPVTLEQLAAITGCNSQYLCRFFKEITGIPPIQYLIQYRIEQACIFLQDTTKSVLEISLDCGFDNVSYFIRKFKELKGCTPGEYRKH